MQSLYGKLRLVTKQTLSSLKNAEKFASLEPKLLGCSMNQSSGFNSQHSSYGSAFCLNKNFGTKTFSPASSKSHSIASALPSYGGLSSGLNQSASLASILPTRNITTSGSSTSQDVPASSEIIDKEAVEEVRSNREIPEIKPGYIVQLKVEVPENKRRLTTIKGIVIARRNAGLNTTIRIRRLVAGVGIENLFLLYSPNIKEIKVLDKKRVRRAKLYYLRDKMNALKKQ
ncbi:50S ribosomal protein l19 chloroplastic [Phtheirospermum japonicum]|uniref:50S ribosomal protein l19 chloroplastic n=1 Tax=Phtheirospermum japonicum TaxID=374723 RepID=A0A830CYY8_9LAMI|nr:50S ribosomal protein l19 chloroplastic [Phtheirospermum japonicum]